MDLSNCTIRCSQIKIREIQLEKVKKTDLSKERQAYVIVLYSHYFKNKSGKLQKVLRFKWLFHF